MVKNGDSSHKTKYIDVLSEILNPEGHQNCCICSNVTAILLNGQFAYWLSCIGKGLCLQPAQQACFYSVQKLQTRPFHFFAEGRICEI